MRALLLIGLLAGCGSKSDEPAAQPQVNWSIDVPEVKDVGLAPHDEDDPSVIVSTTKVTIEGQPIVAIRNGAFDPAALDGGALGMKVPKLEQFIKALLERLAEKGITDTRISLLFDRTLPYRTLFSTMYSLKSGGAKRFAIVARVGDDAVAVPITLPDKRAVRTADALDGDGPRRPGADLAAQIAAIKGDNAKVHVGPPSRLKIVSKTTTPASSVTPDIVVIKVQSAYRLTLERCAAKAPAKQALKIGFTINLSGTAVQPKVTGGPAVVVDCIGGGVGGWRFPIPKTADGTPIEIAVELGVEIEPPPEIKVEPGATVSATALRGEDEPAKPAAIMMKPDTLPLGLVVSVSKGATLLWSISGLEGTLQQPRWSIPTAAGGSTVVRELGAQLRSIVARRWDGKERPPETRQIVFMADAATPVQVVAELMFAMRMAPDRTLLFPDIQLSSGFE